MSVFLAHSLLVAPRVCNCTAEAVAYVAFVYVVQIDACIKFLDTKISSSVAKSDVIARLDALAQVALAAVIVSFFCRHRVHAFFLQLHVVEAVFVFKILSIVHSLLDLL